MRRGELVTKVEALGIPRDQAEKAVAIMLDAVREGLKSDTRVSFSSASSSVAVSRGELSSSAGIIAERSSSSSRSSESESSSSSASESEEVDSS